MFINVDIFKICIKMSKLKYNPFEHQATIDYQDYKYQPFILDDFGVPNLLKQKIFWNFNSPDRLLIKIISLKGLGKSTISFFL